MIIIIIGKCIGTETFQTCLGVYTSIASLRPENTSFWAQVLGKVETLGIKFKNESILYCVSNLLAFIVSLTGHIFIPLQSFEKHGGLKGGTKLAKLLNSDSNRSNSRLSPGQRYNNHF